VSGGEFTAEWVGADTGGISVKPHAVWCEGDRRLKITAVRGETGVGLLVYPVRSLNLEAYQVFDPGLDTVLRPGAALAGRWVREKQIVAYQSDSGTVRLDSTANGLGGKFTVRMRGLNNPNDTVRVTGHFGGLVLDPCLNKAPTPSGPPG
jgi:hypothetical protein